MYNRATPLLRLQTTASGVARLTNLLKVLKKKKILVIVCSEIFFLSQGEVLTDRRPERAVQYSAASPGS